MKTETAYKIGMQGGRHWDNHVCKIVDRKADKEAARDAERRLRCKLALNVPNRGKSVV